MKSILDQLDEAEKYFKLWPWQYIPAGDHERFVVLPREHLRALIDCAKAAKQAVIYIDPEMTEIYHALDKALDELEK